jgi:hypothetical protein
MLIEIFTITFRKASIFGEMNDFMTAFAVRGS